MRCLATGHFIPITMCLRWQSRQAKLVQLFLRYVSHTTRPLTSSGYQMVNTLSGCQIQLAFTCLQTRYLPVLH